MSSDNYLEEVQPLFKLLRNDQAFRFVIVQYNNYSLVKRLKEDLQQKFPTKKTSQVNAESVTIDKLVSTYYGLKKGIFFIENFEDVLKEVTDSQGKETTIFQTDNARRRAITTGLNLRRDTLAQFPIALVVFVSATAGDLYAKSLMEKMPDLWSFRSWILELEMDNLVIQELSVRHLEPLTNEIRSIDTGKQAELDRLLKQLNGVGKEEVALRLSLYPQLVELLKGIGQYQNALIYLDEWYELGSEEEKGKVLFDKGDLYKIIGDLENGKQSFEKALIVFDKFNNKNRVGLCYERLGDIYLNLGNLNKALSLFENYRNIEKELVEEFPEETTFKQNLAISYEKLGSTQSSLGNLEKALAYFEDETVLFEELYDAHPQNVSFKNGLAISYEKLGSTQSSLGNLEKALAYFEKDVELTKELYDAHPQNVSFKRGLAISYSKLGETQSSLGNLEKALAYFEKDVELTKELYDAHPQHVSFKNGLAISYSKLGETQSSLGNLEKALAYFEDYKKLTKELYDAHPQNVSFKNGLAISYYKLAQLHEKLENNEQAFKYFQLDLKFTEETYLSSPNNNQFRKFLIISYNKMGKLSEEKGNAELANEYFEKAKALEK